MIEDLKKVDWIKKEKPWMNFAIGEYGTKEITGSKSNSRIVEYHSYTKLKASNDSVPWCSSFCCWVIEKSGIESTKDASARSWLKWGRPCNFEEGSIVVMKRGSGWQGHVGFAVKKSDSYLWVLGGNQSDSVNVTKYPLSKVLGYRIA